MNKGDLIKLVAEKANLTQAQATDAMNVAIEGMTEALKKEDKVSFIGFGTFSVSKRNERKGKNPATGKEIIIPAMNVVKFKPGKALKDAVK